MDTPCAIQSERASRNVDLLHNWTVDAGIAMVGGAKAIYFVLTSFKRHNFIIPFSVASASFAVAAEPVLRLPFARHRQSIADFLDTLKHSGQCKSFHQATGLDRCVCESYTF